MQYKVKLKQNTSYAFNQPKLVAKWQLYARKTCGDYHPMDQIEMLKGNKLSLTPLLKNRNNIEICISSPFWEQKRRM